MHFLFGVFIALINNIDNIGVRIAYSIRGIKITIFKNLWISLITFIISSMSAFSGNFITRILNKQLCSFLSMILLAGIGMWIIFEPHLKKKNTYEDENENLDNDSKKVCEVLLKPETADMDNSKDIDFKEATLLGIALSINNIGGGLSAGIIGINIYLVGFLSALISFLALLAGNYMAEFVRRWDIEKKATIICGILLILIGVKQVI